uniref:Uncharacterized protein n=1 Tax=Panagrellus redivivus TaxID=6233 RepID=A0A7E4VSW7_PANRE
MDNLGSKPNSVEANTALQNDGIVHNFDERAYVFSTCHAINRPSKCATSSGTARRTNLLYPEPKQTLQWTRLALIQTPKRTTRPS